MTAPLLRKSVQEWPLLTLMTTLFLWKLTQLFLALLSPGQGYDTSSDLLFTSIHGADGQNTGGFFSIHHISTKLARWDAIYFLSTAKRGHLYEQEWAFGWGYSRFVASVARVMPPSVPAPFREAVSAILIANVSHLLSVVTLFLLCRLLLHSNASNKSAFIPAFLHIFAPAGIFLSAPYGESLFSFLTFFGYLCYANSFLNQSKTIADRTVRHDFALIMAGLVFGLGCLVRSNGLLNGIVFAFDLLFHLAEAPQLLRQVPGIRYVLSVVIAGSLVAIGFAGPQYLAYTEFCSSAASKSGAREWCSKVPPSIYSFVQQRYWGVGFFRYWTVSNIPLFILAAPMLTIMITSACWVFKAWSLRYNASPKFLEQNLYGIDTSYLIRLALPQVALALLTLTSFHVQIITRIASAHPIPYFWIAQGIEHGLTQRKSQPTHDDSKWILRWMVIYALVQGALFASFLPPA